MMFGVTAQTLGPLPYALYLVYEIGDSDAG